MFEIPEDLDPALVPMAFLLGTWEGQGVLEFPTAPPREYRHRLVVEVVPGQQVLRHTSESWWLDDGTTADWESGFWRPGEEVVDVELVAAHANGLVEVLYGRVRGVSVELGSDAVLSTSTGERSAAATRTYGLVEGDLAYAFYRATAEVPMTGERGARLQKVAGT